MKRPPDTLLTEWSWAHCLNQVKAMARLLPVAVNKRPFALYGVPRGGLVFGLMLAHELDREGNLAVQSMGQGLVIPKGVEVAVVIDDVCETGATFKDVRARFDKKVPVVCAAMVTKVRAEFDPDVSGVTLPDNIWITFPWELAGADDPNKTWTDVVVKDADAPQVDYTAGVGEDGGTDE